MEMKKRMHLKELSWSSYSEESRADLGCNNTSTKKQTQEHLRRGKEKPFLVQTKELMMVDAWTDGTRTEHVKQTASTRHAEIDMEIGTRSALRQPNTDQFVRNNDKTSLGTFSRMMQSNPGGNSTPTIKQNEPEQSTSGRSSSFGTNTFIFKFTGIGKLFAPKREDSEWYHNNWWSEKLPLIRVAMG